MQNFLKVPLFKNCEFATDFLKYYAFDKEGSLIGEARYFVPIQTVTPV